MSLDLNYYCWRERVGDRLLIPHANPMVYEDPVDVIFESVQEAVDYRDEHYPDETEWVLVHHVGTIIEGI